ncbi:hypothetical protein [Antrihabitans stalactiti]|uniref:1,4-alpha-glucan branching enzyme n=1 Tax=Antrihabitans stalactiti TaxID=2584121 RepID=A0A848KLT9_9NOCA|nr:hypothetical protein [Antrihabitans stalactiti]NMN99171.1 hypothetical protein [Antrihabitans stalactiti]
MAPPTRTTTTDHEAIRRWVEARGGTPTARRGVGTADASTELGIDFSQHGRDDDIKHISWTDWFAQFEHADLAFSTNGSETDDTFFEFVSRN